MIHFGKSPSEDKIIIEVSEHDIRHLQSILTSMPMEERLSKFAEIKELIETDPDLRKYIR